MTKRILITGATGLLGSSVLRFFRKRADSFGLSQSKQAPNVIQVDLRNVRALKHAFQTVQPHVVVHCAAAREPDFCEAHQTEAQDINIGGSESIARIAQSFGTRVIHISTDSVFFGDQPPYREDDLPRPCNFYGWTKWMAETKVASLCANSVIVRLPLLYGSPAPQSTNIVQKYEKMIRESPSPLFDHVSERTPTFVDDVALILWKIVERPEISGALHLCAPQPLTHYRMAEIIAETRGLRFLHSRMGNVFPTPSPRPLRPIMDITRLAHLGLNHCRSFKSVLSSSADSTATL